MIAVIDYGAGNIFSVKNALDYLGFDSLLTNKKEDIEKADGLILPGVGAFPSAMKMLEQSGLTETIKTESKKKPFLGICLGMQLIFQKGYEFEECDGLGLIPGSVRKMEEKDLIIPHMGWNKLEVLNDCPLLAGLDDNSYVYFVHSYYLQAAREEDVAATTEYIVPIHASVESGNTFACQFHPEKSGDIGLQILKNFCNL